MDWKPLGTRIIVKRSVDTETVTDTGLVLVENPETSMDKTDTAEVLAVGSGKHENGSIEPMPVKVGDTVLYHKHYGTDVDKDEDGNAIMVLTLEDLIGVIPPG